MLFDVNYASVLSWNLIYGAFNADRFSCPFSDKMRVFAANEMNV